MRRAECGAHYVMLKKHDFKFLHVDVETNAKTLTSCPHDATLFTSFMTAIRYADDLRKSIGSVTGDGRVGVMQTRTNAPNVLSGAAKL